MPENQTFVLSKEDIKKIINTPQPNISLPGLNISKTNLELLFTEMKKYATSLFDQGLSVEFLNQKLENQLILLKEQIPFKKQGKARGEIKRKGISLSVISHFPFQEYSLTKFITELQKI